jgi:hypothetical protein
MISIRSPRDFGSPSLACDAASRVPTRVRPAGAVWWFPWTRESLGWEPALVRPAGHPLVLPHSPGRRLPDEREWALNLGGPNRQLPDDQEQAPNPGDQNRQPPNKQDHAPKPPAHAATRGDLPKPRDTGLASSPSPSPRSRPPLTVFRVCQGIFPALTNPKNRFTTIRDRGDGEAQSARTNQRNATEPTTANSQAAQDNYPEAPQYPPQASAKPQ